MDINQLIAQSSAGGRITLPSGEFEGPLIVAKPLHLIGNNTTIWAKSGAVIEVRATGVTLENLRAEITEGSLESAVITASAPTVVNGVEVLGAVRGFGAEDGHFDVPRTIELGSFQSDAENTFSLVVNVPTETVIECAAKGVKFSPGTLKAGRNELLITVSGISAQTLLYAEVLFKSRFQRRIYLTGRPKADAPKAENKRIYTAPERTVESAVGVQSPPPKPVPVPKTDVISLSVPQSALEMSRGQRIPLDKYLGTKFQIRFTCEKPTGMEIDPYAFLLDEKEHSLGDEGLVFFGNESSPKGEVTYFPADGHIEIDIARMDYRVRKIALAYSIYAGNNSSHSFSAVKKPRVAILDGDSERVAFTMDGLTRESTVIALELYLYKGEWKICAVGAGYNDGMAKLCNRYGIEVEG